MKTACSQVRKYRRVILVLTSAWLFPLFPFCSVWHLSPWMVLPTFGWCFPPQLIHSGIAFMYIPKVCLTNELNISSREAKVIIIGLEGFPHNPSYTSSQSTWITQRSQEGMACGHTCGTFFLVTDWCGRNHLIVDNATPGLWFLLLVNFLPWLPQRWTVIRMCKTNKPFPP